MELALTAMIGWLMVVAIVVARGWLRQGVDWTSWDVLCGVRALAVERLSDSLALRLEMVGAGCEWGRQARMAGHFEAQRRLSCAAVQAARVMARQLDEELARYQRHTRVLQAATVVEPLWAPDFSHAALQALARGERALGACLGPVTRLRLHLWMLRRGLGLLVRRCDGAAPGPATAAETLAAGVHADLNVFARATLRAYSTLLLSLAVSRRRLRIGAEPPRGWPAE